MTHDAWPSSDAPQEPLPRIEDLPVADQGYAQEAVREAFDTFYRHAAQLDVSLRALEAVEVFRRDADALRNDLRSLRSLGFGHEPDWAAPHYGVHHYDTPHFGGRGAPVVVFRLAAEAALIVAVAVIAGVAQLRPLVVVILMAAAFVIVALSEWLAARARFVPPALAFLPLASSSAFAGEPAPYVEAPRPAWGLADEPDEETQPEALTIVASAEELEAAVAAAIDPWERGPGDEGLEDAGPPEEGSVEATGEPDASEDDGVEPGEAEGEHERAGLFRRRRR